MSQFFTCPREESNLREYKNLNAQGLLHLIEDQYEESLTKFNEAIIHSPLNYVHRIRKNRGLVYLQQRNWNAAFEDFDTVLKEDTRDALSRIHRGCCLKEKEKWIPAIEDFLVVMNEKGEYEVLGEKNIINCMESISRMVRCEREVTLSNGYHEEFSKWIRNRMEIYPFNVHSLSNTEILKYVIESLNHKNQWNIWFDNLLKNSFELNGHISLLSATTTLDRMNKLHRLRSKMLQNTNLENQEHIVHMGNALFYIDALEIFIPKRDFFQKFEPLDILRRAETKGSNTGGESTIMEFQHPKDPNIPLSVKMIHRPPGFSIEFVYEQVRAYESLSLHPNILPLLDCFQADQSQNIVPDPRYRRRVSDPEYQLPEHPTYYLVSHFVSENLEEFLHSRFESRATASPSQQSFSSDDALFILLQVFLAIRHLQAHKHVHHDINPTNIMIDHPHDPRVFLIDFGLARNMDATGMRISNQGATPPETIPDPEEPRRYPHLYDIWGVGVVGCWMGSLITRGSLGNFNEAKRKQLKDLLPKQMNDNNNNSNNNNNNNNNSNNMIYESFRSLIEQCLQEPQIRIHVDQAILHCQITLFLQCHPCQVIRRYRSVNELHRRNMERLQTLVRRLKKHDSNQRLEWKEYQEMHFLASTSAHAVFNYASSRWP